MGKSEKKHGPDDIKKKSEQSNRTLAFNGQVFLQFAPSWAWGPNLALYIEWEKALDIFDAETRTPLDSFSKDNV